MNETRSVLDNATSNARIQETYFQSVHDELLSLKNRVREVTSDPHWLTDGEWKESVLRTILRRHLPSTVSVGRGLLLAANTVPRKLTFSFITPPSRYYSVMAIWFLS